MSLSTNFPAVRPSLLLDFAAQRTLDPRITFVRASPATYYDGETTAKAEENLLLWSQEFQQSVWVQSGVTVVANSSTAPDGTSTADKVIPTASSGQFKEIQQNFTITNGLTYAFSVFLKADGYNFVQLLGTGANWGTFAINFNLSTGVETQYSPGTSTILSRAITSVGSGWYRVSVVITATGSSGAGRLAFNVIPAADSVRGVTWTGDGTSGILGWGAQIEQRNSVTAYTVTTTSAITNYISVLLTAPAGTARFDHNPVTGESLGLLIEETRTNLVSYSSAFDNAYWTKLGSTITPSTNVAPDGTLTAATMTFVSGSPQFYRSLTKAASAITYTISCYAKAYTASIFQLQLSDNTTGQCTANFNLATGVVTGTTAGTWASPSGAITPVGNGWYRCSLTGTSPANTGLLPTFVCPNAGAIFVWGAQLEETNPNCLLPSSYIATVASAVQRNFDNAKLTGTNFSSWWNKEQGSAFIEYVYYGQALNGGALWTQTAANQRLLWQPAAPFIRASTVNTASAGTVAVLAPGRAASAYSAITNETAQSTNGATTVVRTDYNGEISRDYIEISFMHSGAGGNVTLGWCKKVAYYDVRLTNAQLQNLTRN